MTMSAQQSQHNNVSTTISQKLEQHGLDNLSMTM